MAQVNHDNNSLLINEDIWQHLNDDVKKFVLWHEEGHLKLDTRDEFIANGYAVDKYVKSAEIKDPKDFSRSIIFLTNTYDLRKNNSPISIDTNKSNFVPIAAAIIAAVGGIGSALISKSNIGSKARKKEASYMAELQMQMEAQRQQSQKQLITYGIIGIVVIIVLITVLMVVKNKMK